MLLLGCVVVVGRLWRGLAGRHARLVGLVFGVGVGGVVLRSRCTTVEAVSSTPRPKLRKKKQNKAELTSIRRFLVGCLRRRRRTDGLEYPSGIPHAGEGRSCLSWQAGQILDLDIHRLVVDRPGMEAVPAGRSYEGDVDCSSGAGCTEDRCGNRGVLTF